MNIFKKLKTYNKHGRRVVNDPFHKNTLEKTKLELTKTPQRTKVINFLLSLFKSETCYLEIGVRNPGDNYNHINADTKYSVDPGLEYKASSIDFKMTSDSFFDKLNNNEILSKDIKFDVIFIDGLHLAEQVDLDIKNALDYIKDDGFIVLHDCNPPTEWHAREDYDYKNSPAQGYWNGTTWKAFLKSRFNPNLNSCCIDTDWGVGILSKKHPIGDSIKNTNPFYEYKVFDKNRKSSLNPIGFDELKKILA
ncbi:MAG: class I SAM-dependent methyltransferase [Eudoraea sp.]|uniref:class I SAM-dependent methyltransferase n=1 Tax=Eudoraea sp. TaxID=1979955 RepID=UPI003C7570D4